MQPITSVDGGLLDKFFPMLQEKKRILWKKVVIGIIVPLNVIVQASKSGKSSDEKYRTLSNQVLGPLVSRKFLLFFDFWITQTDLKRFRAVFPN